MRKLAGSYKEQSSITPKFESFKFDHFETAAKLAADWILC